MTAHGRGQCTGVRGVGHARHLVEQLQDALGARGGGEDRIGQLPQRADRRVQLGEVGDEHQQASERQLARGESPDTEADDEHAAEQLDQADERSEQAADARRGQLGVHDRGVLAPEPRDLGVLAVERLNERRHVERLLGDRGQRPAAAALLARRVLDQPAEAPGREVEQRDHDQRRERELPRQEHQGAVNRTMRKTALTPSPSAESRKRSIAWTSPVSRASRSPTRRRPSWSALSIWTWP